MPGETRIRIDIIWENNVAFDVAAKENDAKFKTVVRVEENGHISDLWPAVTDTVERYIKALMARIGKDMFSP